jgi:hypothetical protein
VSGQVTVKDGTVSIASGAFRDKQVTSLSLPATVTVIGENALVGCPVEELTVPFIGSGSEDALYLGYLFGSPSPAQSSSYIPQSLTKVTVLDGCTTLGDGAFAGCRNLAEIVLPSSIVSVAEDSLKDTAWLKNHKAGVVYTGRVVYGYVAPKFTYAEMQDKIAAGEDIENVYDLVLRDDVVIINRNAFAETAIRSIRIPDTVTVIGNRAFYACSMLSSVRMPNYLEELGASSFNSCSSLVEIYIPGTVAEIRDNTFNGCRRLGKLILGDGVASFGEKAFHSCDSLTSVLCMFSRAQWNAIQSHETNSTTIYATATPRYNQAYENPAF